MKVPLHVKARENLRLETANTKIFWKYFTSLWMSRVDSPQEGDLTHTIVSRPLRLADLTGAL